MNAAPSSPGSEPRAAIRSRYPGRTAEGPAPDDAEERTIRNRLARYLSGGGLKAFTRTVAEDERAARQELFLVFAAVAVAVWLAILIFA